MKPSVAKSAAKSKTKARKMKNGAGSKHDTRNVSSVALLQKPTISFGKFLACWFIFSSLLGDFIYMFFIKRADDADIHMLLELFKLESHDILSIPLIALNFYTIMSFAYGLIRKDVKYFIAQMAWQIVILIRYVRKEVPSICIPIHRFLILETTYTVVTTGLNTYAVFFVYKLFRPTNVKS